MTTNQRKLIVYIDDYQAKTGIIPSLKEMVIGIGAKSNKTVLRVIESLTKSEHLEQVGIKKSNVLPTRRGLQSVSTHFTIRFGNLMDNRILKTDGTGIIG